MKHFQFRLKRLMRVRELEEQASRERWASHERLAQEAQERMEAARKDKLQAFAQLREAQIQGKLNPAERITREGSLEQLVERIRTKTEQAQAARLGAEAQRTLWSSDRARVQSLERLEERDRGLFHAERVAHENIQMDEIASMRTLRKQSAPASDKQTKDSSS